MPARIVPMCDTKRARGATATARETLVIGLVNNMPDGAIRATELQFQTLLEAASGDRPVELRLLALADVPRDPSALAELMSNYTNAADLQPGDVDALIITGAEPRTAELQDEAYWQSFTQLVDWARAHTVSSIFSCLAAHGAALHLDGIARRPLDGKLSGLFDCAREGDHPLLADGPDVYQVPHSRWNELAASDLEAKGYTVLTRSARAGADTFVRDGDSLFVFFQGHMEYDARSLLAEYHRDIVRFIKRERDVYPQLPEGYLDATSAAVFAELQARVLSGAARDALISAAAAAASGARLTNTWRAPATNIYANWLTHIAGKKYGRQD